MITEQQQGKRTPELYEVLELIDQESEESKIVDIVQSFGQKYSWFTDYLRCVFDEKVFSLIYLQGNLPTLLLTKHKFRVAGIDSIFKSDTGFGD